MEYNNDWNDWGPNDWGNGWTSSNTISQNYSQPPPPKEHENQNRPNKVNQPTSSYFDGNTYDWFQQNPNSQGQSSYSFDSISNNNTINQIENREVAPPDNKQRFDNPPPPVSSNLQNRPNHSGSSGPPRKLATKQPAFNHPDNSLSNYFDSKPVSNVPTSNYPKPFYSQPSNSQTHLSGPASIGGDAQGHWQGESQFASLEHQNSTETSFGHPSNINKQHQDTYGVTSSIQKTEGSSGMQQQFHGGNQKPLGAPPMQSRLPAQVKPQQGPPQYQQQHFPPQDQRKLFHDQQQQHEFHQQQTSRLESRPTQPQRENQLRQQQQQHFQPPQQLQRPPSQGNLYNPPPPLQQPSGPPDVHQPDFQQQTSRPESRSTPPQQANQLRQQQQQIFPPSQQLQRPPSQGNLYHPPPPLQQPSGPSDVHQPDFPQQPEFHQQQTSRPESRSTPPQQANQLRQQVFPPPQQLQRTPSQGTLYNPPPPLQQPGAPSDVHQQLAPPFDHGNRLSPPKQELQGSPDLPQHQPVPQQFQPSQEPTQQFSSFPKANRSSPPQQSLPPFQQQPFPPKEQQQYFLPGTESHQSSPSQNQQAMFPHPQTHPAPPQQQSFPPPPLPSIPQSNQPQSQQNQSFMFPQNQGTPPSQQNFNVDQSFSNPTLGPVQGATSEPQQPAERNSDDVESQERNRLGEHLQYPWQGKKELESSTENQAQQNFSYPGQLQVSSNVPVEPADGSPEEKRSSPPQMEAPERPPSSHYIPAQPRSTPPSNFQPPPPTPEGEASTKGSRRLTPSPHQKNSEIPVQANQPINVPAIPEQQGLRTPVSQPETKSNLAFQRPYNNLHPIASSSPLVSNIQPPENQESLPENREYPDNTETITQGLESMKINPVQESEPETQSHCVVDRNQYLETGQFSGQRDNYVQNIETNDESEAPPPGLHRLVTGQGYEPWQAGADSSSLAGQASESTPGPGTTRNSTPLSSIGAESEDQDGDKNTRREVPGEAEPFQGRVVLGQVPTPPQDTTSNRGDRDQDRLQRMVVGEQGQSGNTSDDYRQSNRSSRHPRRHRKDSSYEEEDRDYSSDRERRGDDHRRRDDRTRRRREHRSPEFRSDEEYEDRRGYHRSGRDSRRRREYSPDRSYYRDYYRDEDPRHHRSYYGREYDEFYRENPRSRPSSRSGSDYRHHSYRPPGGHPYYENPYGAGGAYPDYSMKYSQRTFEYFERLRHADPAGYAAWYSQYMQSRMMQESSRAFSSDRASVHSGQSSSNQRHGISTPQEAINDLNQEEEEVDYTPKLYDSAHIRGCLDSHGRLLIVDPNYPLDHQKATVNLCRITQVPLDKDSEDFFISPGPFIPGITHRNTVLQYLKKISDRSTRSSEKLLYDLVYMTVKGNGEINGSDVAELLMESYRKSLQEEQEAADEVPSQVSSKEVTARFRELLQQGNKAEALDWAMDNGAWGHALFLASKMGEKTHNNIMLRFANSIPHNDPLQTLYQLMSGYIPQSATCCADKKWSDWRPHLAMILSNPTGNLELDRQAVITLGDSLSASGRLFASQFCYVTAQVEFSSYDPDAKIVLLGSSHREDFANFASCRAIMLTMCYEYGLKLKQPNFSIPSLQVYKLILAARLIDSGRVKNALQYCELLAQEILTSSASSQKSLVSIVIEFSSRLKMLDPVLTLSGNTEKDPDWLANLKQFYDNLRDDDEVSSYNQSSLPTNEHQEDVHNDIPYQISDSQQNAFPDSVSGPTSIGIPSYTSLNQTSSIGSYQPPPLLSGGSSFQPLTQPLPPRTEIDGSHNDLYQQPAYMAPTSLPYQNGQNQNNMGYLSGGVGEGHSLPGNLDGSHAPTWEPRAPPAIPPSESQSGKNSFFKETEEQLKLNEVGGEKKKESAQTESKAPAKNEEQSSGWLGGIWGKISLRPKNQMRLPDDKNPTIIWDDKKKKWVNLDGENEESVGAKPPPKASEALPPQGNKYKIQKGRLMKSNYVDVMGNKENKGENGHPGFVPNNLPPPPKNNFFVPAPVENENAPIDFITPAPQNPVIAESSDKQQLSRSSSVSSLSREVQFYMAPKDYRQRTNAPSNVPPMYNPSRFPS